MRHEVAHDVLFRWHRHPTRALRALRRSRTSRPIKADGGVTGREYRVGANRFRRAHRRSNSTRGLVDDTPACLPAIASASQQVPPGARCSGAFSDSRVEVIAAPQFAGRDLPLARGHRRKNLAFGGKQVASSTTRASCGVRAPRRSAKQRRRRIRPGGGAKAKSRPQGAVQREARSQAADRSIGGRVPRRRGKDQDAGPGSQEPPRCRHTGLWWIERASFHRRSYRARFRLSCRPGGPQGGFLHRAGPILDPIRESELFALPRVRAPCDDSFNHRVEIGRWDSCTAPCSRRPKHACQDRTAHRGQLGQSPGRCRWRGTAPWWQSG